MSVCIGCDPGLSGAVAAVCFSRGLLEYASLPTVSNGSGPDALVKRKVHAGAAKGIVSTWARRHGFARDHVTLVIERMAPFKASPAVLLSMGYSAGILEGTLMGFSDLFLSPLPQQWKKIHADQGEARFGARSAAALPPRGPHIRRPGRGDAAGYVWGLGQINGTQPAADPDDQFGVAA